VDVTTPPAFRLKLRATEADADPSPGAAEDPDALKMFERAARLEPNDPDYHYILGQALLRARRFAEAARVCREAVDLNRENPDYQYALGAALWGLGRYEDAEGVFREAMRLRADDARALNGLGCALTRLGRRRAAVAVFHDALDHGAPESEVRNNLGVVLWAPPGRTKGALRAFSEAVRLAPGDADLQRNLALALGTLGRHDEAVAFFRQVAQARPADPEAHLDLAETLHGLGRDAEAQKAVDEALRLNAVSMAARPQLRELRDARRVNQLREELGRQYPNRYRVPILDHVLSALGYGIGGLTAVRRTVGSVLVVIGLALIGYGAFRVVPVHFNRFLLQDDIEGIAGAPVRSDADILDRLMHAARERGLAAHIGEGNFEIHTRPKWRRIICRYEVPVQVLPGLVHSFRFHIETEKPYLLDPDPVVF